QAARRVDHTAWNRQAAELEFPIAATIHRQRDADRKGRNEPRGPLDSRRCLALFRTWRGFFGVAYSGRHAGLHLWGFAVAARLTSHSRHKPAGEQSGSYGPPKSAANLPYRWPCTTNLDPTHPPRYYCVCCCSTKTCSAKARLDPHNPNAPATTFK